MTFGGVCQIVLIMNGTVNGITAFYTDSTGIVRTFLGQLKRIEILTIIMIYGGPICLILKKNT